MNEQIAKIKKTYERGLLSREERIAELARLEENHDRAERWAAQQVSAPAVVEEPGQFPELGPATIVGE